MAVLFKRLRARMREQGVTGAVLQLRLGHAKRCNYVSNRLRGIVPFTVDEAYNIMDILYIPHSEFQLYFPQGGIDDSEWPSKSMPNMPQPTILKVEFDNGSTAQFSLKVAP